MTNTATADLMETLSLTDYPWHLSRRGVPSLTLADEETTIRVSEDDGTFVVATLTGGKAELIADEVTICGTHAVAILLATIDAIVADAA